LASLFFGNFEMKDKMKHKFGNDKAFTLIEILIVLGIIAGMMAFAVSVVGTSSGSAMRQSSREMMRMIKYVYNQAALTSEYYRIVFDLSEQKYFVEYSAEPFYIVLEDDEKEAIRIKNEEDQDEPDEDETPSQAAALGNFAEFEDDLLEIHNLPSNIKIADIFVSHHKEKIEEGKVYLYFFPKGYTEFAVIHLSDEDGEDFMTLVVNPLTGRVDVRTDYVEHEELLEGLGEV